MTYEYWYKQYKDHPVCDHLAQYLADKIGIGEAEDYKRSDIYRFFSKEFVCDIGYDFEMDWQEEQLQPGWQQACLPRNFNWKRKDWYNYVDEFAYCFFRVDGDIDGAIQDFDEKVRRFNGIDFDGINTLVNGLTWK